MKKIKLTLAFSAMALSVALILAGCGGSQAASSSAATVVVPAIASVIA